MKTIVCALIAAGLATAGLAATDAQAEEESYNFIFVHHAAPGHQFWEIEKNGMEEACALINADCQMVFLQTQDGNIGEVLQNLEAAVEQQPDGIATTIMDPEAFDGTIQRAMDMGIPVVSYNVDDADGAAGSARMGYMGSNLIKAGYTLGLGISKYFPEEGPIHVLLGTNDPGQQWSQHRTLGAEMFMEEFAAANPDRDITWANIDAGYDLGVTGARVSSYIQTNPNTTAYLDNGFWEVGVARALRDLGYEPGQILLGGFDLNTFKLEEMKENWIQVTVDQQPYLQAFLSVMQLYLHNKYGLGHWSVDTGELIVTPDTANSVLELSAQNKR